MLRQQRTGVRSMETTNRKLYAMVGAIGSGKTTFAKRLAEEKNAVFFSIDQNIKQLGQPINSQKDYDKYYFGMREIIADHAVKVLKCGVSVVLDFGGNVGHWEWLSSISADADADVEIFHLVAPIEVRRERIRKRNLDPDVVFRFSDQEFESMPVDSAAPIERPGLKVTLIPFQLPA